MDEPKSDDVKDPGSKVVGTNPGTVGSMPLFTTRYHGDTISVYRIGQHIDVHIDGRDYPEDQTDGWNLQLTFAEAELLIQKVKELIAS